MENKKTEEFKRLFCQLESDFGWDIILYDFYGIFKSFPDLEFLSQIEYKWHSNPYCMKIKSDSCMFSKCVKLKDKFLVPKMQKGNSFWGKCYCGVVEYIVPINVSGVVVGVLNISGFRENQNKKRLSYISKKLNIPCDEISDLFCNSLKNITDDEKKRIEIYTEVLAKQLQNLCEEVLFKEEITTKEELKGDNLILLNAIDYIRKHYNEDISPSFIARKLNISLSHLQHIFSNKTGHGIATEIRDYRLSLASELLYTTNDSVKSVAISTGFINVDYFSVLFKKKYNLSPLEYRKQRIV